MQHCAVEKAVHEHYSGEVVQLRRYHGTDARDRNHASFLLAPGGHRVLEIGCGGGSLLFNLGSKYRELFGVELVSSRALAVQNAFREQGAEATIAVGNVEVGFTQFPDGFFDTVVWSDVIEHVFDLYGAMNEVIRLLGPGGTLVTSTPNVATLRRRFMFLSGRFPSTSSSNQGLGTEGGEIFDGGHLHYFTFSSLRGLYRKFELVPVASIACGSYSWFRQLRPSLLSGSVTISGLKTKQCCP